jgi:Y_Y_Y domain
VAISGSTIRFNGSPVYVEGQGISIELFKSAFQTASISPSRDTIVPRVSVTGAPTGSFNDNVIGIRWIGMDNVSLPAASSPNAIQYSYRLVGRDDNWSPWTAATYVEYANLPPGSYTFSIKAKDEAGNITAAVSRPIVRRSGRSSSLKLAQ